MRLTEAGGASTSFVDRLALFFPFAGSFETPGALGALQALRDSWVAPGLFANNPSKARLLAGPSRTMVVQILSGLGFIHEREFKAIRRRHTTPQTNQRAAKRFGSVERGLLLCSSTR